jgi:hypothetical protein
MLGSRHSLLAPHHSLLSAHRIGARHHADRSPVGGIEQHDATEARIAADPYHLRIGDDFEIHGRRKCVVWSIDVIGR